MHERKPACRVILSLGLGLAFAGCETLSEGTTQGDTPTRSPELQALNHFVGTWDMKVTVTPATGEATTSDTLTIRRWSHDGQYLVMEDLPGEGMLLPLTYDPASGTYPGVMMLGPSRILVTGSWNEETKTMHWSMKNVDQKTTFMGSHRFVRDDYAEASGTVTNADGQVVVKLSWKQTRRGGTTEQGGPP